MGGCVSDVGVVGLEGSSPFFAKGQIFGKKCFGRFLGWVKAKANSNGKFFSLIYVEGRGGFVFVLGGIN